MSNIKNKEYPGHCIVCDMDKIVIKFKGDPVCLDCLVRDDDVLTIEQFIYHGDNDYSFTPEVYFFE
jgi:hypothetical protein